MVQSFPAVFCIRTVLLMSYYTKKKNFSFKSEIVWKLKHNLVRIIFRSNLDTRSRQPCRIVWKVLCIPCGFQLMSRGTLWCRKSFAGGSQAAKLKAFFIPKLIKGKLTLTRVKSSLWGTGLFGSMSWSP